MKRKLAGTIKEESNRSVCKSCGQEYEQKHRTHDICRNCWDENLEQALLDADVSIQTLRNGMLDNKAIEFIVNSVDSVVMTRPGKLAYIVRLLTLLLLAREN